MLNTITLSKIDQVILQGY